MLEFNGKRPLKKNLTIEPIALSDTQNQQLNKIMASKKKRYKVRKVMFSRYPEAQGEVAVSAKTYRLMF